MNKITLGLGAAGVVLGVAVWLMISHTLSWGMSILPH